MGEIDIVILEKGKFSFIDEIVEELNKNTEGINFKKVSSQGCFNKFDISGLNNFIEVIINNPYVEGIIASFLYDSLKFIWKNVSSKKVTIVKSRNEIKENEDILLSFKIGNLDFKLPNNLSDDLKEKFIDKAFNLSKQYYREKGKHIVFYNKENDSFEVKEYDEILKEIIKEKINN
ncbi:hypothetical protein P6P35_09670 [Clostridium perfringens]|uniref:hypothetical protein n=1 Tax=Clostridium perfringens TaxID=1502 RepID=UPI001F23C9A9|nr:hypothetical protein [Clostridium perfringens]MDK0574148.1 hypothetical protein [Clostridium perfringens]UBL01195.1 hypothetical protein KLF24_02110 [Clostridium perfringens]